MRRFLLAFPTVLLAACAGRTPSPETARVAPPAGSEAGAGETVSAADLTRSGKPNVWKFTRPGPDGKPVLVRRETDLNSDGRVDVWEWFDADGAVERQAVDLDFDGKPDAVLYFEKGLLVRKELSFGFDGKPHVTAYYEKGKLVRKEKDDNGDGKVDTWEYWEGGELDRVGVDTDGDGKVDRWEVRRGESAASPAAKADAAPSRK
jgi:hypothetical protein